MLRPYEIQTLRTFCACSPFGPWATSNSTLSPSARLRKPFASLNHFTLPLAILLRPQHNGARPRTGTTHATAAWDGLKQKSARHLVLAERRQPVTVPRMLEPRAKVLTPPYPVNHDCPLVSRALLRHHRNTSDRADDAITSVFPLTAVGWRRFHVAASATVVSPTATAREHYRAASADRQSRSPTQRRRGACRRQTQVHGSSTRRSGTAGARRADRVVRQ